MADTVERRRAGRLRTLKHGRIFIDAMSTLNCAVRNMGAGGARLVLPSVVGVPERFTLDIAGDRRVAARVVWKTYTDIGVAFEA